MFPAARLKELSALLALSMLPLVEIGVRDISDASKTARIVI